MELTGKNVHERICDYCMAKGMKTREVREKSGIPDSTWHKWKAANVLPSLSSIVAVADTLNCTVDELIGRGTYLTAYVENVCAEEVRRAGYIEDVRKTVAETIEDVDDVLMQIAAGTEAVEEIIIGILIKEAEKTEPEYAEIHALSEVLKGIRGIKDKALLKRGEKHGKSV